ncbi:hypothetical protein HV819_09385 [Anaerococcus sp. AGMB00486]|uniref:DUF5673 domain-containing protein n=2 Tax=Anaerococcus TaxID=165779 RepID=A0ABX2NBU4_9FIRM|nr:MULTISPECIES: hypothetical protein [Anaerococcus]MSS78665.1 hypothetical protein [Anaerococcus porci]NVF12166.1 hypothetical protein [Anaerococcus faecalis]
MKYIIICLLIFGIIYLMKIRKKIELLAFSRYIFSIISLGLFLILLLIIYKYSPTFIDFLIVSLISILFQLNIKLQGLSSGGLYVIKGSPFLSQFIEYRDIKNFEIIDKKSYLILRIRAYGTYFDLNFKKDELEKIKNFMSKVKDLES